MNIQKNLQEMQSNRHSDTGADVTAGMDSAVEGEWPPSVIAVVSVASVGVAEPAEMVVNPTGFPSM